jgi:tetratricopeptide (TPR) repeat protein
MGLDVVGAEANVRRALDLSPADDPERPEILLQMAMILTQLSRYAEAIELFDEAHEAFLAAGNVPRAAVTLARGSIPLGRLGDPRAGETTTRALELLEPLPPSPELVVVLAEEAGSLFVAGRMEPAISAANRALAVAVELGLPPSPRALGFRGGARAASDPAGLADLESALALADEQGLGREGAVIRHNLANQTASVEGPASSLTGWEDVIEFSRRRGIHELETAGSVGAVEALTALGRWDEVLVRAASVRALAEADGDVLSQLTLSYCTVFIATARGETGDLAPTIPWIISASRETGEAPYLWMSFPPVAWATLELGGAEGRQAAIALLAEMDEATTVRLDTNYAVMHSTAVRTAVAAGDIALAERLRVGFEPVLPLYEHMLVTSAAVIAEAEGELDRAAAGYTEAAARWEAFETPWERAQALLGLGRCLIALGRADEAGSPLAAAREVFAKLRARPSLAEVDSLVDVELAESG